jgi:hypothetical protein
MDFSADASRGVAVLKVLLPDMEAALRTPPAMSGRVGRSDIELATD